MSPKLVKAILALGISVLVAATPLLSPLSSHAQTPGQNLLVDGDFEAPDPWVKQNGIDEVQVAPGWRAWYLDLPPSYVQMPTNCTSPNKPDCYWMRPEFRTQTDFANRIHSGVRSQKYFSYGRMHEAGLYQQVNGITPGTALRFSIYTQAWMCFNIDKCGKNGVISDAPADMHLKVGIDPYGGTNPFSSNVVWSPEMGAFDRWVEFSVQATAQAGTVTVFTHSRADWPWARIDNDVYLDDASLVVVGQEAAAPTATGQPASTEAAATLVPGTAAPINTPAATATPRPNGSVVHVVQAGDTLFGISLQYDVPLEDLYSLNNLSRDSVLEIGQEIVVKAGTGTAVAAQTTPTATLPITPTAAPTLPPPTATPTPGGLCLSAFEDLNNNNVRDGGELSLPGVTFVVQSGGSQVAQYTTEESAQPYCLATLPPGAYTVEVTPPPGYVVALEKTDVALALGQPVTLAVAAHRGEKATPTLAPTVPAQAAPARTSTVLITVVLFVGLLLVLIGIAVVIVRRRR